MGTRDRTARRRIEGPQQRPERNGRNGCRRAPDGQSPGRIKTSGLNPVGSVCGTRRGAVPLALFAMIVDRWGWQVAQIVLVVVAAASFLVMEVMSRWYERRRRSG